MALTTTIMATISTMITTLGQTQLPLTSRQARNATATISIYKAIMILAIHVRRSMRLIRLTIKLSGVRLSAALVQPFALQLTPSPSVRLEGPVKETKSGNSKSGVLN